MVKIQVKTRQAEQQHTTTTSNSDVQDMAAQTDTEALTAEFDEPALPVAGAEEGHEPTPGEQPAPEIDNVVEISETARLKQALAVKEQEAKEHYDARLRVQAEFDNFKKRKEKELSDFRRYANEGLVRDVLPVIDDLDRAIAAAEQTHKLEDFLKGIELIFEKFSGILKRIGVKAIDAEGQPFNPEIHEAIAQIESADVPEGTVLTVFQKGYYLHDRVIVAPKVSVAKQKTSPVAEADATQASEDQE